MKAHAAPSCGTAARFISRSRLPVYAFFVLIDRIYQYYRFGSFFNTYVSVVAREARQRDSSLPYHLSLRKTFSRRLLRSALRPGEIDLPLRSVVDPDDRAHRGRLETFQPGGEGLLSSTAYLLLLAYICFYARYTVWSGDFAWGDRYVSTSVELAALLAVPLLLRYRRDYNGSLVWIAGIVLVAISTVIQIASLCFLVAAGDLPDGDAGSSDVRHRLALQEHICFRLWTHVRLGLE